jgi:hypothetical protein
MAHKPERIETPFVTPERAAKILGVSKRRMERIVKIADSLSANRPNGVFELSIPVQNGRPNGTGTHYSLGKASARKRANGERQNQKAHVS